MQTYRTLDEAVSYAQTRAAELNRTILIVRMPDGFAVVPRQFLKRALLAGGIIVGDATPGSTGVGGSPDHKQPPF